MQKKEYISATEISFPGEYKVSKAPGFELFSHLDLVESPILGYSGFKLVDIIKQRIPQIEIKKFVPAKNYLLGLINKPADLITLNNNPKFEQLKNSGIYICSSNAHVHLVLDSDFINYMAGDYAMLNDAGKPFIITNELKLPDSEHDGKLNIGKFFSQGQKPDIEEVKLDISCMGDNPSAMLLSVIDYLNKEIKEANLPLWKVK